MNPPGFGTRGEEVELQYVFDFDENESVVYAGSGLLPGRVFLLRFWRHAKNGMMRLLGYRHQGHWRDPTLCHPDSYVRYYKPNQPTDSDPKDAGRPDVPPDSSHFRRSSAIEQMAYRVPLIELEPGVWELPTLKGQSMHVIESARVFPNSTRPPRAVTPNKHRPPLTLLWQVR